jgi:CubicO group peptidase (beta-lactamase class C family)
MKQRLASLAFSLVVLGSLPLAAQLPTASPRNAGFDPARLDTLHSSVAQTVRDGQHAGVITLLARDGKIADVHAHGHRDLEQKLPMQRDTICRLYSMSKIVASVGVLVLFEEGRFQLDDPAAKFLPELGDLKVMTGGTAAAPQLEPLKTPVTIKHLLTHTSGLIYDFDGSDSLHQLYQQARLWDSASLAEFTTRAARLPLRHQPGDAFTYGISTDVLGALIERVTGQTFGEFLQARVFTPLRMKDTGFDVPPEKLGRLAKTYQNGEGGRLVEAGPFLGVLPKPGLESGGAGLFSTVDDYARFAQMLLNGGTLDGRRVLGRKTVELMTANHLLNLAEPSHAFSRAQGFGLGVEVQRELGRGALPGSPGAFGWYGAATTYCRIDPAERTVAILLAQHFPFNQHNLFGRFATGYYSALK